MKTIRNTFRFILLLALGSAVYSCSQQDSEEVPVPSAQSGVPVKLSLKSTGNAAIGLNYSLYVFSHLRGSSDPYLLEKTVTPIQTDTRLQMQNQELREKDYRFLFTATPATAAEIQVLQAGTNAVPTAGTAWKDIRLKPTDTRLSIHNYYQIEDISGLDILKTDSIRSKLGRLPGQMEFRFFKIGENITDTDTINLKKVVSIFDRIYKISIEYTGFSTLLSFKEGQTPVTEANDTEGITQEILLTPNDSLGIEIPQDNLDTLAGGAKAGGKIHGLCFLPTPKKIKAILTFYYYDTAPKCENPEEKHVPACYEQRTLQLQIPLQLTETTGLPIEPDTYTVNHAGIRCDRIIDIRVSHNADILTNWNNLYQ